MSGAPEPRRACYCCAGPLVTFLRSARAEVDRCAGCGSLLARFAVRPGGADPWDMPSVTPAFLRALGMRRALQAERILRRFRPILASGAVLDYGCGQGAFVRFLRERGIPAAGCDLSTANADPSIRNGAFIALSEPWELPPLDRFATLCFLDVLEHSEAPGALVETLASSRVGQVIVKVPLAGGPIAAAAALLSRLGRPGLLERLLLAGEVSPHFTLFSARGLARLFESRGFALAESLALADVGRELPDRLRGPSGKPKLPAGRWTAALAGAALAALAPLWSDTRVFLFRRGRALARAVE